MAQRPSASSPPRSITAAVLACLVLSGSPGTVGQERTGGAWEALFDGKTLTNWTSTHFIGEGKVFVEDGHIVLESGNPLTGITWTGGELPRTSYELTLQAMRISGSDFFAGITFPVGGSFCSLILGGWGGTVVGLSSLNGRDASENETTQSMVFESGGWYTVRIRVTPAKIEAWLDGDPIIDQDLNGVAVSTRIEVEPSQPLGVASYRTKAALRGIRLRRL
jgi:hypothetical protein